MFTDLVGSVDLKRRLGAKIYGELIARHDSLFMDILHGTPGAELIQDTGDGFFALFPITAAAVEAALKFQFAIRVSDWPGERPGVRVGLHQGQISELPGTEGSKKLVGLAIDLTSRLMGLAQGGQILMTRHVFDDARQYLRETPGQDEDTALDWVAHGTYRVAGLEDAVEVFEVGVKGHSPLSPPPDGDKAQRLVSKEEQQLLGWRPAMGLAVPHRRDWILEAKLGEGGMGEAWVARQRQLGERRVFKFCFDVDKLRTLRRELTLFKLIRNSLGDRADINRLYDVQLDHAPYFLESEYAEQGDLSAWAKRRGGIDQVPLATRIELATAIIEAVAAAHSVGVLHKDLKPYNILIHEDANGYPHPRLADFGIGEIVEGTDTTVAGVTIAGFTEAVSDAEHMSFATTRMYAPPEGLIGKPYTMQGDIYALGVILYQLVVGDLARPLAGGWQRDVTDDLLRADIAKSTEGDPSRRFPSAATFAENLRLLDRRREREQRERDSQRQTATRRRRTRLIGIGALVLLTLTAFTGTAFMREQVLRKETERAHQLAQREAAKAAAVSKFLSNMLSSVDPAKARGKEILVKEVLDLAARELESKHDQGADQALIEAAIRRTLGNTYFELGKYEQAERHLTRSTELNHEHLGAQHPETLQSQHDLAWLWSELSRYKEAEQAQKQILDTRRRVLGAEHPDTLQSMRSLAVLYNIQNRYEEAQTILTQALDTARRTLGDQHIDTYRIMGSLASVHDTQGDFERAVPMYRDTIAGYTRHHGEEHPNTQTHIENLAIAYEFMGRYKEAEELYEQALRVGRQVYGEDHPYLLASELNLAGLYHATGRYQRAEEILRELIATVSREYGERDERLMIAQANLGDLYLDQDRLAEAEPLLLSAQQGYAKLFDAGHPNLAAMKLSLGELLSKQQRHAQAEALLEPALARLSEVMGESSLDALGGMNILAETRLARGNLDGAGQLARKALELATNKHGEQHPVSLENKLTLARILLKQARYAESEQAALAVHQLHKTLFGTDNPITRKTAELLHELYLTWGKPEQADAYAAKG